MKRKKDHTKPPFFKVRAGKRNSSKFFSFLKKIVVQTNKHVEHPPPQISTWSPPALFFLFFWERAGGRAGVSFSRVHGTGAGHHPGAGTKARFFHECNRAHATGAGNQGPVLPRAQSRTRYRGQRLGRWRRCLATVGDRRDAHPRAREGKGKEGTKDGGPCMCCSRSICCYRKKRTCCGRHRSSSCAVWFVFFCCWYCFSILVTTGGWLGWSGRGGAGRRTQKNSEA